MHCILWDFDNTLAHRPGLWSQCLADLVNALYPAKSAVREQFVAHLSRGFPWHSPEHSHHHLSNPKAWWDALIPILQNALQDGAALDIADAELLARRVQAEYTNPEKWVVFSDAHPALEELSSAGWEHIILSNHVPELPELVEALGLARHFSNIHTSASLGYEKPHANAYAAAISAFPWKTERVIMVGDSFSADYAGAKSAGLEAILVRNSHPECQHAFLPNLADLVSYLHDA